MKYYKFIDSDKKRIKNKYRTDHYLPYWGKPGKWLPYEKRGLIFHGGYDAFKINNLCEFCGDELFEVELPGEIIEIAGTCYSRSMRFIRKLNKWNEDSLRLFAIWCAEHVLDLYELKYPGDTRPREAIETAYRFADEHATEEELSAAYEPARSAGSAPHFGVPWFKAAARAAAIAASDPPFTIFDAKHVCFLVHYARRRAPFCYKSFAVDYPEEKKERTQKLFEMLGIEQEDDEK